MERVGRLGIVTSLVDVFVEVKASVGGTLVHGLQL